MNTPSPSHSRTVLTAIASLGAAGITLAMVAAAPAYAQDAPEDSTSTPEPGQQQIEGGLDFGDRVIVDENGVRWTIDADTGAVQLDDPAVEPDAADTPVGGIEGTGDPAVGEDVSPTAVDGSESTEPGPSDGTDPEAASLRTDGKGRSVLVYLSALAGIVAAIVLGIVMVRRRRIEADELLIIEQPITLVGADGPEATTTFTPSYDGAADSGAYEVGGAAYAQYAAAATGEVLPLSVAQTSTRERFSSLRENVVQRAEKGLTDSGRAKPVARKLEAAGSVTRPGEWLVMAIAMTIATLFFVTFVRGVVLGVIAAGIAGYGSWYRLTMAEAKRQRRFAEALPETLQLLAGGLRGGLSMMQALQNVSDEADEPTASEFQRIMTEARLGRDLAVSLRDLSRRMDSKDFDWVVTAIEIHREVGGDLSAILDRVGNTIRSRNRVLGQVKALSAEGKLSGIILFMLPPGMLAAIYGLNPTYLDEMITDSAGQIMLVAAMLLLAMGGWWLKKLSKFTY